MQLFRLAPIRERVFVEYGQSETEAIKIVYPIGSASATVKNAKP